MSTRSIDDIYNKALKLLEPRQHSVYELERKLLLRGYNQDLVSQVIAKLQDQDYLNDQRFAQTFLDSLIRYKTFGYYGLKAKLLSRGIASNQTEVLLKEHLPFERERETALKVLDKSSGQPKLKIAQKLSRKGFRNDVIQSVLQDFC